MKKIDEKLYDYLQTLAHWAVVSGERVPVVLKSDVKKKYIGDRILGKSVRTVNRHFERLEEFGYLINGGKSMVYILPKATNLTEVLPTKTAQFLADTLKEDVIKIYKYLGEIYKQQEYEFTENDIATYALNTGIINTRKLAYIHNSLICLSKLGLISYKVKKIGARRIMVLKNWNDTEWIR